MNVSDLISRSELTEAIKRQYCTGCDNYNGVRCRACHADDMLSLVDDAADAIPRWISVEERLPEDGESVLVRIRLCDATWYEVAHRINGRWSTTCITHWMPIPQAPKEE